MSIVIKSEREISIMRQAGKIVAMVLKLLSDTLEPGMETRELDRIAVKEVKSLGARPSFKGYHGFPASLCVSINDEIVHGIPGKRILREGDIVSLDFGSVYDGFQGDAAVTVGVGGIRREARLLIDITRESLKKGIDKARDGARLGDISAAIQRHAEVKGYSVIREYTGHGIGRHMHEDPQIPNYGEPGTGPVLRKGMVFALEPMISIGDWHTRVGSDHWTVVTADGSLSAHFEHTIAITEGEAEVLTVA